MLLDGVMEACDRVFASIRIFAVIMHRPPFVPYYPEKHLPREYTLLLQRINLLMELEYPEQMATLIFDEKDLKGDMKRAFAFSQFFFTTTEGRNYRKILDTPLFVASQTCPGLQVADIFAGAIRLFKEGNFDKKKTTDPFELSVIRYYEIAERKKVDLTNPKTGQIYYGFYEMGLHIFPKPPVQPAAAQVANPPASS